MIATLFLLQLMCTAGQTSRKCDVYDGANGTPVSNHRTCSVYPPGHPNCPKDQYCYQWTTYCQGVDSISPKECPGFVGMNLTYKCAFEGAQLYRYRNGTYQYLNGSSVNYGLLLPEHAGLYECRNSTNHTVKSMLMIRISASGHNCRHFTYSSNDECCASDSIWSAYNSDAYYSFVVYANPADNVSVTVEQLRWEVEEETRNDVDIGLYTVQDEQNPVLWRVRFRHNPFQVTEISPKIRFRILASNGHFSHSICESVHPDGDFGRRFIINNVSLPMSKTVQEQEEATFQCAFRYTTADQSLDFVIQLKFSTDNETTASDTCITTLTTESYIQSDENCTLPPMARIEKQTEESLSIDLENATVVTYTFRIPNTNIKLNGSTFTCSLLHVSNIGFGYLLKWRKSATLTVIPSQRTGIPPLSTAPIAASLTVICVVVTVVVFGSVGAAVIVQKKRYRYTTTPSDQVPLTCSSVNSSRSTLCGSEANTEVIHMKRLPSIEVRASKSQLHVAESQTIS